MGLCGICGFTSLEKMFSTVIHWAVCWKKSNLLLSCVDFVTSFEAGLGWYHLSFFSLSHERRLFKLDLPLGIPYFPHFLLCLITCCFFLNHFTQLSFLLPCCCKKKTKLYLDSLWISWEVLTPDFLFKTWMQPIHFELKHSLYFLQ